MKYEEKAIAYCRVSTRSQNQEHGGTSLISQSLACQQKADMIGAHVVHEYTETFSGNSYHGRVELQKALKDIEAKVAKHLIVYNFDRYSRNDTHQHLIKERVERVGGQLHFATLEIPDTTTSSGHLTFGINAVLAVNERLRIKERTTLGRQRKVEQGIQPFRSQNPFGYVIACKQDIIRGTFKPEDEGKYFLNEEQVPWVVEIFTRYARGDSLRAISKFLFENNIRTNRNAETFATTTLTRILRNEIYIGRPAVYKVRAVHDEERVLSGKGEVYFEPRDVNDRWYLEAPALISPEIWNECQKRLKENHERLSGTTACKSLLGGLLRCPNCDKCMTLHTQKEIRWRKDGTGKPSIRRTYHCPFYQPSTNHRGYVCNPTRYKADDLEQAVLQQIFLAAFEPGMLMAHFQERYDHELKQFDKSSYEQLQRQLAKINRKIDSALEAQINGISAGVPSNVYERKLKTLAEERESLLKKVAEASKLNELAERSKSGDLGTTIMASIQDIHEALTSPSVATVERRKLLGTVIEKILVDADRKPIIIYKEQSQAL